MTRKNIAKYFVPWMFQRAKKQCFAELHARDGDNCWRCRRPMRFDLPRTHEKAPSIEHIRPKSKGGTMALDNLCLCHRRCNWDLGDKTPEVKERLRLRAEAQAPKASKAA
jgi:hypothetical protein